MAIETIEYKGYSIDVHQDDNPESPREWDNLGIMVCFHNHYDLGDKHNLDIEELLEIVKRNDIIALPLYLYDHSGIWMSTNRNYPFNCPWDSGQVGYIYVDKATIRKEYGCQRITKAIRNKAINVLVSEVETYSKYISGEVYGYTIDNPEGNPLDGCWGFYDTDYMITEAKGIIDNDLIQRTLDIAECHLVEVGCYA